MTARYAIYYAPESGSPLAEFGARWLGRDAETDEKLDQPQIDGLSADQIHDLTDDPRLYGFHGTLKAPFELAAGTSLEGLRAAIRVFVKSQEAFEIPSLELAVIGKFIVLTPSADTQELLDFGRDCVRAFEGFRAPLDDVRAESYRKPVDVEGIQQRQVRLTVNQERMLVHWGYPFVIEEFRFHFSLTNRIDNRDARRKMYDGLLNLTEDLRDQPLRIQSICLFGQAGPDEPMKLVERFPLGR